jgi:hypothetical protein
MMAIFAKETEDKSQGLDQTWLTGDVWRAKESISL